MTLAPFTESRPRYQQIAEELTQRIRGGEYPAGALMPSFAALGEQYAVSQITVRQAIRLLVEQGLVRTVPGKGTIATNRSPRETTCVEHRVGVLLPTVKGWSGLYPALFEELHDLQRDILMKPLPLATPFQAHPERARFELDALRATCGGGLILFGDRFLVEMFLQERRPGEFAVCLENSDGIPASVPVVSSDSFGGTFALTRHLIRLGHRRIAYLDALWLRQPEAERLRPGTTHEQRFAGYRAAMESAGLAPCLPRDLLGALLERQDPGNVASLIRRPGMPTALISFNDRYARDIRARLSSAGVAVPQEVSLAGYDNESQVLGGDWLTSLDQNGPELARQLVRLLHGERERLLHRGQEAAPRILVPPLLLIRDSVAPPA